MVLPNNPQTQEEILMINSKITKLLCRFQMKSMDTILTYLLRDGTYKIILHLRIWTQHLEYLILRWNQSKVEEAGHAEMQGWDQ